MDRPASPHPHAPRTQWTRPGVQWRRGPRGRGPPGSVAHGGGGMPQIVEVGGTTLPDRRGGSRCGCGCSGVGGCIAGRRGYIGGLLVRAVRRIVSGGRALPWTCPPSSEPPSAPGLAPSPHRVRKDRRRAALCLCDVGRVLLGGGSQIGILVPRPQFPPLTAGRQGRARSRVDAGVPCGPWLQAPPFFLRGAPLLERSCSRPGRCGEQWGARPGLALSRGRRAAVITSRRTLQVPAPCPPASWLIAAAQTPTRAPRLAPPRPPQLPCLTGHGRVESHSGGRG